MSFRTSFQKKERKGVLFLTEDIEERTSLPSNIKKERDFFPVYIRKGEKEFASFQKGTEFSSFYMSEERGTFFLSDVKNRQISSSFLDVRKQRSLLLFLISE